EEQFYLLWPAVVFLCSRRRLVVVCIALVVVSAFTRFACVLQGNTTAAYFITPARIDALAVGAMIAVVSRHPGGLRVLTRAAPGAASIALAVFLTLEWVPVRVSDRYDEWLLSYALSGSAVACLCGALLVLAINRRSATERLFSRAPLRFFGRY